MADRTFRAILPIRADSGQTFFPEQHLERRIVRNISNYMLLEQVTEEEEKEEEEEEQQQQQQQQEKEEEEEEEEEEVGEDEATVGRVPAKATRRLAAQSRS
uniref:Uncharacterized protein n=1 Tax=Vespula pensylvanica TaxID=30213 RepID=A0A834PDR7_VESPE|nr:hypothetical protein H0235_000255 [Vespula pensylvanica]